MRRVNYKVKNQFGETFFTTNYTVATQNDNRIVRTFLTEVDEKSPATKIWNAIHVRKIWDKMAESKGV